MFTKQSIKNALFKYVPDEYCNGKEMILLCRYCTGLQFLEQHKNLSSKISPRFSTCCFNRTVSLFWGREPLEVLCRLLATWTETGRHIFHCLRSEYNAMSMVSDTSRWVSRDPGTSAFNPTIILHGRMYHYVSALLLHLVFARLFRLYIYRTLIFPLWQSNAEEQSLSFDNILFHSWKLCYMT